MMIHNIYNIKVNTTKIYESFTNKNKNHLYIVINKNKEFKATDNKKLASSDVSLKWI